MTGTMEKTMTDTTCHMSMSLDGYVAGPEQSLTDGLGIRGQELHPWHMGDPTPTASPTPGSCVPAAPT
jgi:hypothetical protein